jgi:hypothetical protein
MNLSNSSTILALSNSLKIKERIFGLQIINNNNNLYNSIIKNTNRFITNLSICLFYKALLT